MMYRFIVSLIVAFTMLGCENSISNKEQALVTNKAIIKETKSGIPFSGKVVFVNLEGGFWGVITKGGLKLHGAIPVALQAQDKNVHGHYNELKGVASIQMWGKLVQFTSIESNGPIAVTQDHK